MSIFKPGPALAAAFIVGAFANVPSSALGQETTGTETRTESFIRGPRNTSSAEHQGFEELLERLGFIVRSGYYINDKTGKNEWHLYVVGTKEHGKVHEAGVETFDFLAGFSVGNDRSGMQYGISAFPDAWEMRNYPEVHVRFNVKYSDQLRAIVTLSTQNTEANIPSMATFSPETMPAYQNPSYRELTTLFNGRMFIDPTSCEGGDARVYVVLSEPSILNTQEGRSLLANQASSICGDRGSYTVQGEAIVEVFNRTDQPIGTYYAVPRGYLLRADDDGDDAFFAYRNFGDQALGYLERFCDKRIFRSCQLYSYALEIRARELYSRIIDTSNSGKDPEGEWRYARDLNAAIDRAKSDVRKAIDAYPAGADDLNELLEKLDGHYQ